MTIDEIRRLQNYLRVRFNAPGLEVRPRSNKKDSAEVYLPGEDFIGVLFRDEEDGEVSYDFNMAILDEDLDEAMGTA